MRFLFVACWWSRCSHFQFNNSSTQYINRTVTAHAFTSTSSAYVVENRALQCKVTSIGDKIQRRGIAPTNNKNNKHISIFFVTQHQLSIIVKHKQKKSFIKKWQNTYTKTPTSSLQWILKELSKCLKRFYYSFKIFPQFWLAKSTRIIHHNQLLMTKFGRILCLTRKWRQKCNLLQVNAPLTEKTWERDSVGVVVFVKIKWWTLHSFRE